MKIKTYKFAGEYSSSSKEVIHERLVEEFKFVVVKKYDVENQDVVTDDFW